MTMNRGIGDNRGPAINFEPEEFKQRLTGNNADLEARRNELLEAGERVPTEITDQTTAERVTDFIAQITAAIKTADRRREDEKAPFLAGGRLVDGFFKTIAGPLETTKGTMVTRLTVYQRAQAAEEKRKRDEAEKAAREAERLAKEAADKAFQAALDAERAAADAACAEPTVEDAAALEAAVRAEEAAKQAAADAETARRAAAAKPAEMHKDRGDYGSVASLRRFWDFKDLNRADVDLEALRAHIPEDAIEQAIRSFIRSGGRTLKGCTIFENTRSVVK